MAEAKRRLEALIVPAEARSFFWQWKGPAAAAWQLSSMRPEADPDRDIYISESEDSGQWAALIGALLVVVQTAPATNSIDLFCSHEALCKSINEYLPGWQAGGWEKPAACRAEWKQFVKLCEQKHIEVRAIYTPIDDPDWSDDLSVLREITRTKLAEHARKIGSPWGGFDEVPNGFIDPTPIVRRKRKKPQSS